MAITYKTLVQADKDAIKADVTTPDPEPDYPTFLPTWEREHYAHTLLLEKAVADGDEDAQTAAKSAIATLEAAIVNVRAGKRPDGTTPSTPPAPPAPGPTPAP